MAQTAKIDPKNFCQTLAANVDNERLTDAEFRQFVRNSLPIVDVGIRPLQEDELRSMQGFKEASHSTPAMSVAAKPDLI